LTNIAILFIVGKDFYVKEVMAWQDPQGERAFELEEGTSKILNLHKIKDFMDISLFVET